jgi:plastocyanin
MVAESHEVLIANLQFKPASISIKVGDTIVWTNNDDRDHTVISVDGTFASDIIRRGESFSFKYDKPGKFAYGCKLHPRMKGVVVVTSQK